MYLGAQVPAVTVVPDDDEGEEVPRNVGLVVDEAVQQQLWQLTVATNTIRNLPLSMPDVHKGAGV